MDETLEQFEQLRQLEPRTAVATLIATQGTPPRGTGAKMCVGEGGRILGSVTIGGCVDAKVIEAAGTVLASGESQRLSLALGDEDAWELGMTCAGTVEILIEPVDLARDDDPVMQAQRTVRDELARGQPVVEVAPTDGAPARLVVRADGTRAGTLGDPALDAAAVVRALAALEAGHARAEMVRAGSGARELFLDVHRPRPLLLIVGATHVAMPMTTLARTVGFRVVVIDGRERFATRDRFPDADAIRIGMPSELVAAEPLAPSTCVVLVAHDYKYDLPVLRTVLAAEVGYIGLLGSARRGRAIRDFLAAEGMSAADLARVHVPVGLDIGARSASEIALAVLAEVIAVREGRPGTPMRERGAAGGGEPGTPAPADDRTERSTAAARA